ncbi:hypothetical protein AB205_0100090, partial [Aquarana catesbeiana]
MFCTSVEQGVLLPISVKCVPPSALTSLWERVGIWDQRKKLLRAVEDSRDEHSQKCPFPSVLGVTSSAQNR